MTTNQALDDVILCIRSENGINLFRNRRPWIGRSRQRCYDRCVAGYWASLGRLSDRYGLDLNDVAERFGATHGPDMSENLAPEILAGLEADVSPAIGG